MDKLNVNAFSGLPLLNELTHLTDYSELVKHLYPNQNYDYALPQKWVDECVKHGIDPRGQCIWIYTKGLFEGEPAAVTHEFFMQYRDAFSVFPVCPVAIRLMEE